MFDVIEVTCDGGGDELEHVAVLWTASFDDRQQSFYESAAGRAFGPETQLAPDHTVTLGTFGHIVRGFDSRKRTTRHS